MHLVVTSLVLVLAVSCPPGGSDPVRAAAPGLVLNEFLAGPARDWNGSGAVSTRDDEWVEVFNGGAAALDLSSFLLTDSDRVPRYAFAGMLEPGGRRLVFGSDSYAWEKAGGHPAYGLSLGNSGDGVMLWQVAGAETLLVDSYTYLGHEAAADRAVGRRVDGGEWALFDALDPYAGSTPPLATGCAPSPGTENLCGDTPTLAPTWGRIKSLYAR
jgi:hypothetical protein